MNGWQRLALVLSAIYWVVAGFLTWSVSAIAHDNDAATAFGVLAFAVWLALAALWWAMSGFVGRPRDANR